MTFLVRAFSFVLLFFVFAKAYACEAYYVELPDAKHPGIYTVHYLCLLRNGDYSEKMQYLTVYELGLPNTGHLALFDDDSYVPWEKW